MHDEKYDDTSNGGDKNKRLELVIKLVVAIGTAIIGLIELVKAFKQ